MMKKLFSLTLAMVTALGLMLPASAAEETTDEALARVTQAVKAALDLDTDAYDEFQGSWYEDGLTGAWDGRVEEIKAGDVVWCPPDIKHWHGASPTTAMTHMALTGMKDGKNVTWMEEVSDQQYNAK